MISYTLDTNIISYILKGNKKLFFKIKEEINDANEFYINPITYYEVYRGLLTINSKSKLKKFDEICDVFFQSLEIDRQVIKKAAEIYVDLRNEGNIIEDADILIGAICLENDLTLVTNNEKHFKRIEDLKYENWV